jgi:hypothetical protein
MALFGFYRSKHVRRRTTEKKKLARFDQIFRRGVNLDRVRDSQSRLAHGDSGTAVGAQFLSAGAAARLVSGDLTLPQHKASDGAISLRMLTKIEPI